MLLLVWDYNNTHCHRHYHRLLFLPISPAAAAGVLELVLAQNASLTTARRHRMVPRDHNDGFMALYDVGSLRLLTHSLSFLFLSVLGALCFFNNEW